MDGHCRGQTGPRSRSHSTGPWESSRTGTLRSPHVPGRDRTCFPPSGGRGNGGRAGSGPAPPGARLLVWGVPKGKTITFQHKKTSGCQALLLVGEQRSTAAHIGPNRDRATWGHVGPALAMPTRSRTPQCHQHGCCDASVPKDLAVGSQESTCLPSARRGLSPSLGQVPIRALPVASGPPGAVQPLCTGVYFGFNIQGSTQGVCSPAGAQDGLCWG